MTTLKTVFTSCGPFQFHLRGLGAMDCLSYNWVIWLPGDTENLWTLRDFYDCGLVL
jgi:hypothetical protein